MNPGAELDGDAPPRVALVGLRASGKSRVGVALARRLGFAFVDLDREVARLARERGLTPAPAGPHARAGGVLLALGEAAFRDLEGDALEAALALPCPLVLATGGGLVERPAARARLAAAARAVWLDPPLGLLAARLAASGELRPPLLGGADAAAEIEALAARRRPMYAELSPLRVTWGPEASEPSPETLAEEVARRLSRPDRATRTVARLVPRRRRRYSPGGRHGNADGG